MDGIINVLKPPEMTSHDVVAYIRRRLGVKKAGHTGTLDPNAVGVLPVCLGKATRVTEYLTAAVKGYRAELKLGVTTSTQDAWGEVEQVTPAGGVTEAAVRAVMERFLGKQRQVPPMVSAVKRDGKRLYELARQGLEVDRAAREVTIFSLQLLSFAADDEFPTVRFDVLCSKGTYIRTLGADMGRELGCGGHLTYLVRTRSGPFTLAEAATLEEIAARQEQGSLESILLPMDAALAGFGAFGLTAEAAAAVRNGRAIAGGFTRTAPGNDALARLYGPDGAFLAIGTVGPDQIISPVKVLV